MKNLGISAMMLLSAVSATAGMVGTNVNSSVAAEIDALANLKNQLVRSSQLVSGSKGMTLYSKDYDGNAVGFQVVGVDLDAKALHVIGGRNTPGVLLNVSGDALRRAAKTLKGD